MELTAKQGAYSLSLYCRTVAALVDQIVTETGQPARLTDLMRRTRRPSSTVGDWLYAARDAGYIVQQGTRGGWRPAYCPTLPPPPAEVIAPIELHLIETVRTMTATSGQRVTAPDVAFQLGMPVSTTKWYAQRLEARGLLKRKSPKTGYMAAKARRKQDLDEELPKLVQMLRTYRRHIGKPVPTRLLVEATGEPSRTIIYRLNIGIDRGLIRKVGERGGWEAVATVNENGMAA